MSRAIDADAFKAYLDYRTKTGMGRTIAFTFKHMIDEQPTIEPESPWIPCKVRLPDHNSDVLVTNADETEMGRRSDGRWVDCYGDKMKDVTAWMPKPKPYREGE